jgi:hypothetical protein
MKHKQAFELTGQEVHDAMVAAGFVPLVMLGHAIHWIRDGRHAVTHYEESTDETAVGKLTPTKAAHVSFTKLESGEVIAHAA